MHIRRGRWRILACACVIAAVSATACAQAVEVPLKYVKAGNDVYVPNGYTNIQLTEKPEVEGLVPPKVTKQRVLYGSFKLGDSTFPVAVCRAAKGDSFEFTLYLDANRNNNLADDPVIEAQNSRDNNGSYIFADFPMQDIEYEIAGKKLPMCVRFYNYEQKPTISNAMSGGRASNLNMITAGGYAGEVTVSGRNYKVVLGDSKLNGSFGDKMVLEQRDQYVFPSGDRIIFSQDGAKTGYYDSVSVTDLVCFGDAAYALAIDVPAGKLTLTPAANATAELKIPAEVRTLEIVTPDNSTSVAFFAPPPAVKVPAGSYKMVSYMLSRTEPVGDQWLLASRCTPRTPECAAPGEMKFGEPFSVELLEQHLQQMIVGGSMDAEGAMVADGSKKTYRLQLGVIGCAFENVAMVQHVSGDKTTIPLSERNRNTPKEPTYKIVTAEGEKLAEGAFEYG